MYLDKQEELKHAEEISDEELLRSSEKIMVRNEKVYKELAK